MNFVAQVEDHLRDLGAEARKNHPGVKEASERAIIHLRSLQTQYVAAVRRAGASTKNNKQQPPSSGNNSLSQHPTTALFQSQDVLRPFLLAANYPDASYELLVIALESMQLLLRGDAVCPEDGIQISRVLVIQCWGCAGTLGLGVSDRNAGRDDASAAGGTGGMAAGMIHAASSSVSGALGGITGMMLGGHQGTSDGASGGSTNSHHHQHYHSNRSLKEDQSIALKILQTITMLVDSRSVKLTQDVLGACLSVCLLLGAGQTYNEHASGTSVGATIRERLTQSASVANNVASATAVKDGSGGLVGGTAGNVKRAALATMNQLLSILFERAKDAMMAQLSPDSPEANVGESSILGVAEQTLTDLCTLVSNFSAPQSQSQTDLNGPFKVAAKEGLSPSPTTSLALVDMIMKQICGDLFQICFDVHGSSNDMQQFQEGTPPKMDQRTANPGVEFAIQIISQAFQLGESLLGSQYCYHVTKLSLESSLKGVPQPSSSSNVIDFCLYYYTTALSTTILTHYLSSTSEAFYGNFDAYVSPGEQGGSSNGNHGATMSRMALGMMKQLVSFVSDATEAYHKSDDFEDGYIFTQTERESFDIGKTHSMNNHAPSTRSAAQGGASAQPLPVSSISNDKLWRAFLALEVLCHVIPSHLKQVSWLDSIGRDSKNDSIDKFTVSVIAKAASDFATISASNRERILHLLMAAHADDQTLPPKSHVMSKSVENDRESNKKTSPTSDSENSNTAAAVAAKVTDALVIESVEIPVCDAGATTWLAFKCILFLVKSLKDLAIAIETSGDLESRHILSGLVNGSFAPSVSMLQHFIRRMLGSPGIVSQTLSSYKELACASMTVDSQSTNVRRQAILTSLCKLCLPSWGKRRPNCQLKECHIEATWTMLWIIHSNFEKISDEWDIILSTLDQLAIISISSPKLHTIYSERAKAIAGCFIRLPSFTTCFTQDTLSQFITSLVKLSEVVSFDPLVNKSNDTTREYSIWDDSDSIHVGREPSIGGKLISFAGRAFPFGGGGAAQPSSTSNNTSFRRSASTGASQSSKAYSHDLRETTCLQMASSMKISTPHSVIQQIPLPLLLVVIVAEANSYRLSVIEETVASHLCAIAARSSSMELQSFAMEVLIHFMPLSLSKSEISLEYGSGPLMIPGRENKNESPLEVVPMENTNNPKVSGQCSEKVDNPPSNPQLLKILCQTIQQRSTQVDTVERGLNALLVVLEEAGQNLSGENLIIVLRCLSVLSGCDSADNDENLNRSTKQWANVSSLAFQCLKLILDDFLEPMATSSDSPLKSTEARDAILDCCVAFGKSQHDVNTSLTATGHLWSLADRDSSPGTLDVVLSKLAFLAMDDRPELRNCSVNTLFSCVVGLGDRFTDEQWEECLNNTIFGILSSIYSAINESENKKAGVNGGGSSEARYKVAVHHSRDSVSKRWATTQILVLRGLERVLRLFFPRLLGTLLDTSQGLWFLQTWKDSLRVSFDCAILSGERETLDMRLAGVELMTLCAQLSSKAGIAAAGTSARVGTNMEVVGGALRSVRAAVEDKVQKVDQGSVLNQLEVDSCRQELFDAAFDVLSDFRVHLELNGEKESEGPKSQFMIDSLLTQVLTKLTGELAKLYECCKNDEMLPGPCELQLDISIEDSDGYESRFLHLLLVIVNTAGNDKNSRYLNQVQRGTMSLLQVMASNSSLRTFKTLAGISGDYMFVRPKALSSKSNDDYDDNDHVEIFELEAAKTVASAFDSDGLSNEAKVVVMCSVLLQYLKIYGNSDDVAHSNEGKRMTSEARYDIITSVIDSGLEAAAHIDSCTDDKTILDSIWDRIIATVSSLLLPPADNRYDGYAHHSKSILNIVAIVLSHLPLRKLSLAEPMLEIGANRAVEVAFECTEKNQYDGDIPYSQASEGAIHVFLACFMGLCQKMPTCPAVSSLTSKILGETIESENVLSGNAVLQSKTRQSLAIAVCESLRTTTSQDLLVGVFPFLCRLTNVENDGLRRAAGKILGGMNLSEAISRERQQAEQANIRAREIEEENIAMCEEIEYLHAENEELQRQMAVFSESSDFM
mmetsp:Transcript_31656/g.66573  ORF Transcript_31656/g.66573 Transcript_31656/m.66573 type:complete len:2054 (-) Transcript_31656:369-6530(-)